MFWPVYSSWQRERYGGGFSDGRPPGRQSAPFRACPWKNHDYDFDDYHDD